MKQYLISGLVWVFFLSSCSIDQAQSIDSLRTKYEEARMIEKTSLKLREWIEDKLSESLYDECLREAKSLSGVRFSEKQRNSYECWKREIHTLTSSWTVASASTEAPQRITTTTYEKNNSNSRDSNSLQLVQTVQAESSIEESSSNTQKTHDPSDRERNTDGKIKAILSLWGYREAPTRAIFSACKEWATDPTHCLTVALSLIYNESGSNQKSYACTARKNCLWVNSGRTSYKSYEEWMKAWVAMYNRKWYTSKSARFFYAPRGEYPPSRYCTSETSSNSAKWCPIGLSIATTQWEKVSKILNP